MENSRQQFETIDDARPGSGEKGACIYDVNAIIARRRNRFERRIGSQ
jgi:hypothetical protein